VPPTITQKNRPISPRGVVSTVSCSLARSEGHTLTYQAAEKARPATLDCSTPLSLQAPF